MNNETNDKIKKITEDELNEVSGGNGTIYQYTCVNPACSMYLVYLQFQPANNICTACGGTIGRLV